MTPFFFGDADRPLYGVHHEPTSRHVHRLGVLICNGLGRDYMRTHRGLARFSGQLAGEGYHVLRFDYSATGDSFGEDGEGRLEQWSKDIGMAAQELKDLAGLDTISVIGVRVGASLAAVAATVTPLDTLIMWDPIVSGAEYIESQITLSNAYYADLNRFPVSRINEIDGGSDDLVGTCWPSEMRNSIAKLDLLGLKVFRQKKSL